MISGKVSKGRRWGATAVETALVMIPLIMFVFGVFEYGRFLMVRQMVDNAAREGARQAVIGTSTLDIATLQATTLGYLVGQPLLNTSGQALSAQMLASRHDKRSRRGQRSSAPNCGRWHRCQKGP